MDNQPRLTRLSGDTSWLLQLPGTSGPVKLVVDAWLTESETDLHRLFSTQFHTIKPAFSSLAELGHLDGVLVSLGGNDHCNWETLRHVSPDVPMWSMKDAVGMVRGWKHFQTVHTIPSFSRTQADWDTTYKPIAPGVHVFHITSTYRREVAGVHGALLFTFTASSGTPTRVPNARHAILYTPPGVHACTPLDFLAESSPPIEVLAILHGKTRVELPWFLAGTANLGPRNAGALIRLLRPRYWLPTHDEKKRNYGVVGYFQKEIPMGFLDALDEDVKSPIIGPAADEDDETRARLEKELGVICVPLKNGESFTLE